MAVTGAPLASAVVDRSLPRDRRVRRRADFVAAQSRGARVNTRHFVLIVARQPSKLPEKAGASPVQSLPALVNVPASRIGITASRKVGNSVVRSRCKRLVREVFRHDPTWLPAGLDLVVIVRGGVAEMKFAEVLGEWRAVKNQLDRLAKRVLATA